MPADASAAQDRARTEPWEPNPRATGFRRRVGEFVLSSPVQSFVLAVIVVNAITLGLETSESIVAVIGTPLRILDTAAIAIFVAELILKMFALGRRFWPDGWNVFDFAVVAITLVPAVGDLTVLRSLRVLRVLRLINRLPQLRRIAAAIIKAIPGIGAIAALMAIVFYVAAVMATSLFGDEFPELFGTLPASLLSLFQIMTLDSWSTGVMRPIMEVHPNAWLFFMPFILVSAFVMLNLFIAIIVDTMSNISTTEKGTVADPKPVQTGPIRTAEAPATQEDVEALHAELAEIKALLRERRD
ncbi:ion transporter [Gulosibacter sp. 10]|uniref:ion transporter n=1 Tax=Gulosibacter sp. 10 TaxID=1255570 RepID=UPI00097EB78F|nr:ion transporter [Gulosibacter sp. 10]SJM62870.1 Voltage-gated sodium channel subunit [Gulosibacter sp. 10]